MKVALLITTYNRPEYLKQCLWSLYRADLSKINQILIVDDASTDKETMRLIEDFHQIKTPLFLHQKGKNSGIKDSLLYGYELLFADFDIVINLDSDAIVRPDFVERLLENIHKTGRGILTGFHSITKNANGTERHKIKYDFDDILFKESVGGINFCIDKYTYENFVKPSLNNPGNWDHNSCLNAGGAWCLKESVIQHIGFDSSMNHTEAPDIADDFYYWDLPDVTLIGVDSQPQRLKKAIDICTKWIKFGAEKQITHSISSKEQYSEFCIKELYKHVNTSHMLICQHDGYVHNWQAWDNSWLEYDYIGAPWHYMDEMAVGNGGFSLRSRRLMEIVATDPHIQFKHPEDHHICRTYRPYLEVKCGIKFAPVEVAEKFAFEGYMQPDKYLDKQFGKHGNRVVKPAAPRNKYVINQFLSLGDILFLVPLIRELINEGNEVIWPIDEIYITIAKHFPDINFVRKNELNVPYDNPAMVYTNYGKLIPYRFASEIMGRTLKDCMRSKYELYGHNYLIWRNLYWERDKEAEKRLIALLDLPNDGFCLVNKTFGHAAVHSIIPEVSGNYPVVEMRNILGFTLIDWLGVIELASEVHISNSSLNYLLELIELKCDVHIYKRGIWGEKEYEYSDYLFTNKRFIYHR